MDLPYILGFLAVGALTSYWIVAVIVEGANPLAIPIIIAVGVAGSGIGLCVAWLVRTRVIKK